MFLFSHACAIPDEDSVVLTGGMFTENKVSRYQMDQGWVEDLPELKFGRVYHGCAAFTKDDKQVRKKCNRGQTLSNAYLRFILWLEVRIIVNIAITILVLRC